MRNAPIVQGTPSPYSIFSHNYPSRFHGPQYERYVFGGAINARPQNLLTPSYNLDLNMPQPTLSGLGAVQSQFNTGEGIFKPGGYGGGVFDGDISGLGTLSTTVFQPMAITHQKHRRFAVRNYAIRGLGENTADDLPWGQKSDYTISLQSTINAYLMGKGLCPIVVDGKLGPGTCGAARYVLNSQGDKSNDEMPVACAGHSMAYTPVKNTGQCGKAPTASPLTTASASIPLPGSGGMSSSTKRALGFAAGGILAIGAVLLMRKK